VRDLPTFREVYRRCIVPVDGFFEWKAIKGQKAKQPYAVAIEGRRTLSNLGLEVRGDRSEVKRFISRSSTHLRPMDVRLCPWGAFALAMWPVAATTRRCHISATH
jgi:putative SOS response-associated peptidase YedK